MTRSSPSTAGGDMNFGGAGAVRLGQITPFEPDVLTGMQWAGLHRATELSPEKQLVYAVLESGLIECGSDMLRPVVDRSRRAELRALREQARRWVGSDDREWPFSFLNCCDYLGLDASALRSRVLRPGFKFGPEPYVDDEGRVRTGRERTRMAGDRHSVRVFG